MLICIGWNQRGGGLSEHGRFQDALGLIETDRDWQTVLGVRAAVRGNGDVTDVETDNANHVSCVGEVLFEVQPTPICDLWLHPL